jgi:tetrapyrrole methylase family protein/MazG family protein
MPRESRGSAPSPDLLIVGLGPAGLDHLPPENLRRLRGSGPMLLRTERHPAAAELRRLGVELRSLDSHYDAAESFDALYPGLASTVLREAHTARASGTGPLVYAVPGHPLFGEESVRLVLDQAREEGLTVRVLPAPGFVDLVAPALVAAGEAPNLTEWQVADGAALREVWWDTRRPVLIFQVDDAPTVSRVKLALLEGYPEEFPVWVVRHAGEAERESTRKLPLFRIDRPEAGAYDHLCTLYLPPLPPADRRPGYREFVEVVARLRAPDGCPWDREQTHRSLKRYLLEESYEALEAIDGEDPDHLCEELGDVMLQVLLHAQIAAEAGEFDHRDVNARIVDKLIRRHPHVFGDASLHTADEVLRQWEQLKRQEKPQRESALDGVPQSLPALMLALEVSKRAVKVGFEWPDLGGVLAKLDEELAELKAELPAGSRAGSLVAGVDPERIAAELGDLLFTLVNVARWLKIDPEDALRRMVARFSARFREVERLAAGAGRSLSEMHITELDALWETAKGR